MVYRSYVCASLQCIPQSRYIKASYDEMLKPAPKAQDGNQVAADFIRRHKLKFESEVSK
jgi:hypothetical protein